MRLVRLRFATAAFAITGLVGPGVRFLTWPPAIPEGASISEFSYFAYMFTLFLTPADMVAFFVQSKLAAGALVTIANVLVFALAGLLVGVTVRWPLALACSCVVVVWALLQIPLLWFPEGPDSDVRPGFVAALVVYAVPCCLVWWRRTRSTPSA